MYARTAILSLAVALASCDHEPTGSISRDAEMEWLSKGYPAVSACVACHDGAQTTMPQGLPFLAGPTPADVRLTLLSFTPAIVRLDEPPSSPLLIKGHHDGLALTAQETSDLLAWLVAEDE
jgi:hypothetical protein